MIVVIAIVIAAVMIVVRKKKQLNQKLQILKEVHLKINAMKLVIHLVMKDRRK